MPLRRLHLDAQRILFPFPAFRELAADGVGRQIGVGIERILAAVALRLREVGGEQLLEIVAGIVVELPVPVGRIERQRRQRHIDGADLERAAVLRLRFGLRGCRHSQRQDDRGGPCGQAPCGADNTHASLPDLLFSDLSRSAHARIEQIAQRVSEHVGGVDDDGEAEARRQRQPGSLEHEGAARSRQHAAPGRRRRRHAETEERQARIRPGSRCRRGS